MNCSRCVSQGKAEQHALENIKEAIEAWLWTEDQKHMDELQKAGKSAILVTL